MKKIMFNDKYGLTAAVLEGRKTMTRRFLTQNYERVSCMNVNYEDHWHGELDGEIFELLPRFQVGEIIAVAQSYETMANGGYLDRMTVPADNAVGFEFKSEYCGGGYKNKMFVAADLMPHRIRITDIKIERLQDISNEDCMKEGIGNYGCMCYHWEKITTLYKKSYKTSQDAFAALIDKVSGKGTWKRNPWVFAYSFELERRAR